MKRNSRNRSSCYDESLCGSPWKFLENETWPEREIAKELVERLLLEFESADESQQIQAVFRGFITEIEEKNVLSADDLIDLAAAAAYRRGIPFSTSSGPHTDLLHVGDKNPAEFERVAQASAEGDRK